jgi:hypothetical protein
LALHRISRIFIGGKWWSRSQLGTQTHTTWRMVCVNSECVSSCNYTINFLGLCSRHHKIEILIKKQKNPYQITSMAEVQSNTIYINIYFLWVVYIAVNNYMFMPLHWPSSGCTISCYKVKLHNIKRVYYCWRDIIHKFL